MDDPVSPVALSLDEVLERVEEVTRDVVLPQAEAVDRDGIWPEAAILALQRQGLGGLVVPAAAGGLGHGLEALARTAEVLARGCASTAICFAMHCVGSAVIAARATGDQHARYLEPIVAGEHLTTLALSEPGSGSHFYFPQTKLTASGPDYLVDGGKTFVTNAAHADSYVISTVAPDGAAGEFSCLILDAGTPGLDWGEPWNGLGMRGNDSRSLTLDGVRIPRANLLGEEGDELWYVFNVVAPNFLMAMSGTYLGVASAAVEAARDHVAKRAYSISGRGLGEQPVVQHRLGTLWAQVERTRRLIYAAAAAGDAGDPDALPALLSAKAEVAECAVAVANDAMTLAGGIAYGQGSALQRHLRDARAAHVMAPTTDVLRTWVGRALLGLPLLAD